MAKKPEPKPLFELKADFIASLERFTHTAMMMADLLHTLIEHDLISNVALAEKARERWAEFRAAMTRD